MTKRTCGIILSCKYGCTNEGKTSIESVVEYLSVMCGCPKKFYTTEALNDIMFDAMSDYLDSCDKPSEFLWMLRETIQNSGLSNAECIASVFFIVNVYGPAPTHSCINGFTEELISEWKEVRSNLKQWGTIMTECSDYKPEEDNEYPLCKGCGQAKCNSCNLNANIDESKFDPNFCITNVGEAMSILEAYDWELKHPNMTKQLCKALAVKTTEELAAHLDELKIASMDAAYEKFVKIPNQTSKRVEYGLNSYGDIEFVPSDFKNVSFSYDDICAKLTSYKIILARSCATSKKGLTSENITAVELVTELLERIKQINAEVYYLAGHFYAKVEKYEANRDYAQAVQIMASCLSFEGALETVRYHMSLTLDKGAIIVSETQIEPAYLSVQFTTDRVYHYEFEDSMQYAQAEADFINSECRIFKCSKCDTVTYERLANDKQRLERGLQPQQCCVHCRLAGKTNLFGEK